MSPTKLGTRETDDLMNIFSKELKCPSCDIIRPFKESLRAIDPFDCCKSNLNALKALSMNID